MSAIQAAIKEATDVSPKRGEDRQDYLARALKAIAELNDAQWDELDKATQDWFNAAADAKNAKAKTLPDFPDAEEEQAEEKTTRRSTRASKDDADDDKPKAGGNVEIDPAKLKKGMVVKIVTKRGKEVSGHVADIDDEVVVVKMGNGDEEEVSIDRIDTCHTLAEATESKRKGKADADDEVEDPIKVGARVMVTTKRGKEITGKIVEMDDEVIVLKTDDGEEELDRGRVESIKPLDTESKGKSEEKTSSRRSSSKDKGDDDKAEGKTKRASNDGVSVGTRIKELIAADLEATEADIAAKLKKEGLEFRENTLKLNYTDAHKFIEILRKAKLLK